MQLPFLPGWYADPSNSARQRYWRGEAWTASVRISDRPPGGWYPLRDEPGRVRFWDGDAWTRASAEDPRISSTRTVDGMLASTTSSEVTRTSIPSPPVLARWIPYGVEVDIHGATIADGMLYVGEHLPAMTGRGRIDQALVDPSLPVRFEPGARPLGHRPSYAGLGERQRGSYLAWLAAGRPTTDEPGYPFLFYYGLERRLLVDEPDSEERAVLLEQIQRLVDEHPLKSLTRYAARLSHYLRWSGRVEFETSPPVDEHLFGWSLDVQLGIRARDELPLLSDWALRWYLHTRPTLKAAGRRCPHEFAILFEDEFDRRFPGGIRLIPSSRLLRLTYAPAADGLTDTAFVHETDVPRVRARERIVEAMEEIAIDVQARLSAYARRRARTEGSEASIEDLALLPEPVLRAHRAVAPVREWLEGHRSGSITDVERVFGLGRAPRRRELEALATIASRLGFGVVAAGDLVEIAPLPPGDSPAPSRMMAVVAAISYVLADVPDRAARLESLAEGLDARDGAWVSAAARARSGRPATRTEAGREIDGLDADGRTELRTLALGVVGGDPSPTTIARVQRLYGRLGLDETLALGDLHRTTPERNVGGRVELDFERIEATRSESARVSRLLADIFESEAPSGDAHEPPREERDEPVPTAVRASAIPHAEFLAYASAREEWPREELESWTAERGMMLDGVLEIINDAALEKVDDVVFVVYDGSVVVQADVVEELHAEDS